MKNLRTHRTEHQQDLVPHITEDEVATRKALGFVAEVGALGGEVVRSSERKIYRIDPHGSILLSFWKVQIRPGTSPGELSRAFVSCNYAVWPGPHCLPGLLHVVDETVSTDMMLRL
jgi:hypothetical protein